jgi:hypothetical protein
MMRNGTTAKRVASVATTLILAALALPVLVAPASAAGARVGARAIVDTPRGAVLLARVTGSTKSLRVTFACKGAADVFARTRVGAGSDTVAARIAGANAHRLSRCTARAGASQIRMPSLPAGRRAGGARLVAFLGAAVPLAGGVTRVDVAISAPGRITVRTSAGLTLLRTGRRLAGVHRLLVGATRGTSLVVIAVGGSDRIVAGTVASAQTAPDTPPVGEQTTTTIPGSTPAPPLPGQPAPPPIPPPPAIPTSRLSLACPGNVAIGGTLVVTGRITPVVAGATITVNFSLAGRPPTNDVVLTDAGGNYTAQTSDTIALGTWNIQASFAGTPTLQGSQSPACLTRAP